MHGSFSSGVSRDHFPVTPGALDHRLGKLGKGWAAGIPGERSDSESVQGKETGKGSRENPHRVSVFNSDIHNTRPRTDVHPQC